MGAINNKNVPVRLFFAMPLPDDVKSRLRSALAAAQGAAGEGLSFTKAEQLHFTLAFLGEQPGAELACEAGEAVRDLPSFELVIAGSGAFPSALRPRVLWLGVTEGARELCAVADKLCASLRQRGFALEDRPFRPHLTLGRVKPRGERGASRALAALPGGELARMRAGEISLLQSVLGAGGARHTVLRSFALRPGRPHS
jgi:2'-5' RNA ligase